MPERSGKLLLIILCLLPCSVTSFECSLSALTPEVPCPSLFQNVSNLFIQGSKCTVKQDFTIYYLLNIDLLPFPVFIILDLAPLIVYFPVLIIFNINLASGLAQSFLFFYHALTAVLEFDLVLGGIEFLTMQSPNNNQLFPHTLPYIALQYCKLAAVWWP